MEWIPRNPDQKYGRISLKWLECRLVFHLQDEGTSESSVETIEKTLVPRVIWTGGLTSLDILRGSWNSMLQKVTRPDSI